MDEKFVMKSWEAAERARRQATMRAVDAERGRRQRLEMLRRSLREFETTVSLAEAILWASDASEERDDLSSRKDVENLKNFKWNRRSLPLPTSLELSQEARKTIRGFHGLFGIIAGDGHYQDNSRLGEDVKPQRITDNLSLEFVVSTEELPDVVVARYELNDVNRNRSYSNFTDDTLYRMNPNFDGLDEFTENLELLQRKAD